MTDSPPEEPPKDWMEIWYETGDITWRKPLSPEANERILRLYAEMVEEQERKQEEGDGA